MGRGKRGFGLEERAAGDNDREIVGGRGKWVDRKCKALPGEQLGRNLGRVCRPRVGIHRQEMPAEFPLGREEYDPFLGKRATDFA